MPTKPSKLESPDIVGSQKAYDDFLPAAQDLPEADVRTFRADPSLAYHNVKSGLDAIAPHIARITEELPKVDVAALQTLDDLALAVIYAAAQVDRSSDGSTPALLEKARAHRDVLIKSADALAAAGLIPLRTVEKIRAGKGGIDLAQDCVDLAALFTKHAKDIKGKTAVTAASIKEAATIGTDLLKRVKPKGTKSKDPALDSVKVRDRLWTLLVQRHRDLRRVGMWLWADDVDQHVPPLQSRNVTRKKTAVPADRINGQAAPG
ncbi:hypothetical protein [Polyangium jinanense]|uniref:Uncharacterized protein n=1 Tax=Polyangium jinanense TaxID=2829994 RepID=A0A9X3XDP8_9BACT|nr:hypothetical protein [Polyangium jinanense]MDC3988422.1 hypothetical protein [Polyangium jinanense]